MVNDTGHYICDICHKYIRPERNGKKTGEKIVNHLYKVWKDSITGSYKVFHTKTHEKCLKKLSGGDKENE